MADHMLLGLFNNVDQTADAIDDLRAIGIDENAITVMSSVPYASKMLGRKHPRSIFLLFAIGGAITGVLLGLFVAVVTPDLYPIEVGGQGMSPVPPSAIIIFELTALLTMVASFVGFLLQSRLPSLGKTMYDPRITDGMIGIQVTVEEGQIQQVEDAFKSNHANDIVSDSAANYPGSGRRYLMFWGGAGAAGLVLMALPLLLSYDIIRLPWFNSMKHSPAVGFQEGPRRAAPAESIPVQGPLLIGNVPATNPIESSEASLARGEVLYNTNCAICHGTTGGGDGALAKYYENQPLFARGVPALSGGVLPREYVVWAIFNGFSVVDENGIKQIKMPRLGENVTATEAWDIANYVEYLGQQNQASD